MVNKIWGTVAAAVKRSISLHMQESAEIRQKTPAVKQS